MFKPNKKIMDRKRRILWQTNYGGLLQMQIT